MFSHRTRWIVAALCVSALVVYALAVVSPRIDEPPQLSAPSGEKLWTFGFVGDTQLGAELIGPIFRACREAGVEFVVHLGDMVDEAASDQEWHDLLAAAEREQIRLMPVVGNHDKLEDRCDTGEARFRQFFPQLTGTFYHFRHRGLNFLMLNSERSLLPGSEQAKFLDWQLDRHPGSTVVCLHRPVFTCGRRDLISQYNRRLWLHGRLKNSDVVAVLAGHHHYYDRTKPLDGITYVVSGGGSVKLHDSSPTDATTECFCAGKNHFGLVDVYADRLHVRAVTLDGRQLDEFVIPLKPSAHEPGTYHNRYSLELPPQASLPVSGHRTLR